MIPKEKIDELRKSHPEQWAAKRQHLSEQQSAEVILAQIDEEKANPPRAEALRRVVAAGEIVKVHEERYTLSCKELERVVEEVRKQFPDIDLSSLQIVILSDEDELDGDVLDKLRKDLNAATARNAELLAVIDRDALRLTDLSTELMAAQSARETVQGEGGDAATLAKNLADLKAAQELLKKIRESASIKEVRELMKPAAPTPTQEQDSGSTH